MRRVDLCSLPDGGQYLDLGAHEVLFAKLTVIFVIIHIMYFNPIHKEDFYNAT